ncbi:hypothetical protein D3C87_1635340 [compost metagenome]
MHKTLRKYGPPRHVSVVYEAGPIGYGLHRELSHQGWFHVEAKMSHTFSTNIGSLERLNVSWRCDCKPRARQSL